MPADSPPVLHRLRRYWPEPARSVALLALSLLLTLAVFGLVAAWVDQQAEMKQERIFNDQQALQTLLARQAFEDHLNGLAQESSILALYSAPEYVQGRRSAASMATLFEVEQAAYPEYLAHLYWSAPGQAAAQRVAPTAAGAAAQAAAEAWMTSAWAEVSASASLTHPIVPPLYVTQTYQMAGLLYPVRVGGDFRGVLAVVVDLRPLIQRYIVPMRSGQYGAAYLLDGQGNVVYDHETEIIGRNVFDGLHAQYPDVLRLDRRLITEAEGIDEYRFTVVRGGPVSRKLIAWHAAQVGAQKLVIALSAPDREIEAGMEDLRLQRAWLTAALGLALLAGSAAFFRARQRLLQQGARRLQQQVEERTAALTASEESARQAYSRLKDSEQQLASIIDFLPDPVFVLNSAGEIIAWNRAMELLTGQPAARMLGKGNYEHALPFHGERQPGLADLVLSGTQAPLADFADVTRRADGSVEGEGLAELPSGSRWYHSRAAPLYDAEGRLTGAVEILRDITGRKKSEEEIRRLTASLEQRVVDRTMELSARTAELDAVNQELNAVNLELSHAVRSRDEFLAAMSHELRTPLTAILGMSEALLLNVYGPVPEKQRRGIGQIFESGQHLLALINDILDLSKVEAGKVELELRPMPVHDVCLASLRLIAEQAQRKGLTVLSGYDPDARSLLADERRVKQILVNLLGNAVKFTPQGGKVGLEVKGDRAEQVVRFTVWDTGVGIAPELMPRLFRPFVQLDTRLARAYEGTGLGLALVRRLTELHGGSVTLESDGVPGHGCRFTVALPWAEGEPAVGAEAALDGEGALPAVILIADDNDVQRALWSDSLRNLGCHVVSAADGQDALERARLRRPDLVLMDVQMPGLDGLEVIRRMRADPAMARAPIVAVTGLVMPGDRERCLAAGATAYLSKPFRLAALLKVIRSVMAEGRAA